MGRDLREAFSTDEYQILLVANKFQTGFDQPLLCVTAMQRYSGYVITLLPVGLAVILFLISPGYMTAMVEKPPEMFGLPMGVIFFAVGLVSMGIGYIFIRRIVDIKV